MQTTENSRTHEDTQRLTYGTIIIGGGQAGLAAGYFCKEAGQDFIILDAAMVTGDSWRARWDSLRLFTPAGVNGLPGMPFPGNPDYFPTKDEVADFLLSYKQKFHLPVLYGQGVTSVMHGPVGYQVRTANSIFFAHNVIVATGAYHQPKIPSFSRDLNRSIKQVHSSRYTNAADLPTGDVLVVGAGTSGLQIAMDLRADGRTVTVAGHPTPRIPDIILKYFQKPFLWFAGNVLTTRTPMGRKLAHAMKVEGKGAPLIRISMDEATKAGIRHVKRIAGQDNGMPITENGGKLDIVAIVWATGFTPDYSWLQLPGCVDQQGYPIADRGISVVHGLYFVGSTFQYSLQSTWLGGIAPDARYVVRQLVKRQTDRRKP